MLHIQIDPQSGVPAYRQVMDQIKLYMASGVLPVGQRLPSIRELARELSVNPTTVVKAYGELQHEGVIEMRHGKGAFVKSQGPALSKAARREALRPMVQRLAVEAHQLGLSDVELGALMDEVVEELETERRGHAGCN